MAELTVGSLFSGIGGLDLGLERAGMRVIWQSEIDPFANKVLKKHWPEVVNHGDIKEINWDKVERPNVICGGYPCQPFSQAGKRRGEEDPRHLWPWVRDAISRLRPDYAILENVRGHLTLGGLSVIGELASIGYDAEWRIVSAASVGANHRRDRIIIVAYPASEYGYGVNNYAGNSEQPEAFPQFGNSSRPQNVAYPNDARPHRAQVNATETGEQTFCRAGGCCADVANSDNSGGGTSRGRVDRDRSTQIEGRQDKSQSWACRCCANVADATSEGLQRVFGQITERGGDGFAYSGWEWWQIEPDVGRVANGVPNRVDRLRGLGNAVVPQVAEVIGRLVVAHDAQRT